MNILVAGNLSSMAMTFAYAFTKEKFKVVLASSHADDLDIHLPGVRVHSVSPASDHFNDIVSAHTFDAVIYIATREEHLLEASRQNTGEILDGLRNILELCRKASIKRVFYISSTEIYGDQEPQTESEDPLPASLNGSTLRAGEEYCAIYSVQHHLAPTIIRVPFIYGQGEKNTFLHDVVRKCIHNKKVVFPGFEDTACDFLHAEDVAEFIIRSLDMPAEGSRVVNLPSANTFTFGQLANLLKAEFPEVKFEYSRTKKVFTRPVIGLNAKKYVDWIAERKLAQDLPDIITEVRGEARKRKFLIEIIRSRFPRFQTFLQWVEVLLGAVAMHYLSGLSGSIVEFRYVDFRLAYVVLLGIVYGTRVALITSALAGLSVMLSWSQLGLNWVQLVYNVSNWLPYALYLAAAVISGYIHDKKENDISNQAEELELVKEKYTFLYDLYQEVTNLKNQFHKQLVGSRDSFGRIFNIAQELDTLEEEEVIFKALHVLEDVLDNRSIAIYSIHQSSCYARLEIYSSSLSGQINKSLNLRDYPDMVEQIAQGEIFQNRALKPGWPAYFFPIMSEGMMVAGVAVWDASYEQFSLYYANLFSVICGLIQSSINRVFLFMNANIDRYYIPHTKILLTEYFAKVIRVKSKIKRNKLGSYLLVKVGADSNGYTPYHLEKLYTQIAGVTRAEDYVGILGDGNCYILLSQADHANAASILNRLAQRGLACQVLPDDYRLPLDTPVSLPEPRVTWPVKKTGPLFLPNSQVSIVDGERITRWDQTSQPEAYSDASSASNSTVAFAELPVEPKLSEQRPDNNPRENPKRIIPDTGLLEEPLNQQFNQLWRDLQDLHSREQNLKPKKRYD